MNLRRCVVWFTLQVLSNGSFKKHSSLWRVLRWDGTVAWLWMRFICWFHVVSRSLEPNHLYPFFNTLHAVCGLERFHVLTSYHFSFGQEPNMNFLLNRSVNTMISLNSFLFIQTPFVSLILTTVHKTNSSLAFKRSNTRPIRSRSPPHSLTPPTCDSWKKTCFPWGSPPQTWTSGKAFMRKQFGNSFRAWRHALDLDGSMNLQRPELFKVRVGYLKRATKKGVSSILGGKVGKYEDLGFWVAEGINLRDFNVLVGWSFGYVWSSIINLLEMFRWSFKQFPMVLCRFVMFWSKCFQNYSCLKRRQSQVSPPWLCLHLTLAASQDFTDS